MEIAVKIDHIWHCTSMAVTAYSWCILFLEKAKCVHIGFMSVVKYFHPNEWLRGEDAPQMSWSEHTTNLNNHSWTNLKNFPGSLHHTFWSGIGFMLYKTDNHDPWTYLALSLFSNDFQGLVILPKSWKLIEDGLSMLNQTLKDFDRK